MVTGFVNMHVKVTLARAGLVESGKQNPECLWVEEHMEVSEESRCIQLLFLLIVVNTHDVKFAILTIF